MNAARLSLLVLWAGQWVGVVAATHVYRTDSVECPADLLPGGLALYPHAGNGNFDPFAVVVLKHRARRRRRATGVSLLVAPTIPDLCRGS